jgi:hypothetical protein
MCIKCGISINGKWNHMYKIYFEVTLGASRITCPLLENMSGVICSATDIAPKITQFCDVLLCS